MIGIVEGFDAQGIAGEGEPFLAGIPDGKGEHAVEAGEAVGPVLGPGLQQDLGVGLGLEGGTAGLEVTAKLEVVVDLAIKDDVPPPVGRGHGLGPAREVEDAEPAVSETDGGVSVDALGVRSTVGKGAGHGGQRRLRIARRVAMGGETGDAAHHSIFGDRASTFKRGA